MSTNDWPVADSDIAVIGMACRFPGAPDVKTFWANLAGGVESISLLDASQAASANPAYAQSPNFRAAAGVLPDIEQFDAGLFGYSPREAELMDPQQRIFLECAWETFEDAGYVPSTIDGLVGVYAGCGNNTYLLNHVHPGSNHFPGRTFLESVEDFQILLGNQSDFIATRVSYKLNLRGPSINLQTACSTSLVAIHLACQSLILGECDMALAGCATLRVPQDGGYLHEEGMVFSPDGHTRAFDAQAQGTTFGSGVAAVLLKPLKAALADGDIVYAVIKGSAVNNDGARKLGFTAPSIDGQAAVVQEALSIANVSPDSIGYVEAHGTGTALGDPIEVAALKQAFGPCPTGSCALGSVKTNLGHLSWSAGMAGFMKTVLALKHGQIPPTLHFQTPNPRIELAQSPFTVHDRLIEWPALDHAPRRAGVSAFGVGGTNAHIVLEEAPRGTGASSPSAMSWHVLTLSAKSPAALVALMGSYQQFIAEHPDASLADLCHTANTGRTQQPFRTALAASSLPMLSAELAHQIEEMGDGHASQTHKPVEAAPALAFLFSGQGAQYVHMGRTLYETQADFRQTLERCDAVLQSLGHASVLDILYPPSGHADLVHDVAFTQTAIFSIEYALAQLWMSWGVAPSIVMGHSTGEYVAACIAGVFSLEDGLLLCAERGKLFKERVLDDGLMASVNAPEADIRTALEPYRHAASIASVNGPLSTVISGRRSAVEAVCAALATSGITSKTLEVQRAGHSPLTDRILDDLYLVLSKVRFNAPGIPIVSNVTGRLAGPEITTPAYWCRHTREAVLFSQGMRTLWDEGVHHFLEIGPDPVLLGMGAYCLLGQKAEWIPSLRRPAGEAARVDDWQQLSKAAASLYKAGLPVDWRKLYAGEQRQRIALPTYPFQRQRHWIDASSQERHTRISEDNAWARGLLKVNWQATDQLVAPIQTSPAQAGTWLIMADTDGLAEHLRDLLLARSEPCILAYEASHYECFAGGVTLRSDKPEHMTRLIAQIDAPLKGVVFLWPCSTTPGNSQARTGTDMLRGVWHGCEALLHLIQAIVASGTATSVPLLTVTRNTQPAQADDKVDGLLAAPLWALALVAGMEHPELRCRRIDLGAHRHEQEAPQLLQELLSEGRDDAVAWRATQRFVAHLAKVETASPNAQPSIHPDGCYLITGGLGGLGLLLASWLVEQGARHLLLMGRHAPNPDAAAAIALLSEMGARIQVLLADVADADALAHAMAEALPHPPLRGVFHAAGVIDDAVVMQQDRKRFLSVLRPKVEGAWNLHRLLQRRNTQLDHFVMFSSAASLLGNAGQANHASANAFLDALAHHRRALDQPALSVNWGAWIDVGELRQNTTARRRIERLGFDPIHSHNGLRALAYAMAQPLAQIGMSPMNWAKFLPAFNLQEVGFFASLAEPASSLASPRTPVLADKLVGLDQPARAQLCLAHVRKQAMRALGMRSTDAALAIDDHRKLSEYGLDSLSAIELRNSLQQALGQPLSPMLVVDCPTISDIAQHLAKLEIKAATPSRPAQEAQAPSIIHGRRELSMQQRRWLSLIQAGYGARVVPIVFHAELNEDVFRRALLDVVSQHELLRYVFPHDQVVVLSADDVVPAPDRLFLDLSKLEAIHRSDALAAQVRQCWADMPDPAERPSWAIRCLKYPDRRFLLLLTLQHLDFDGTALSTFVMELKSAYKTLLQGQTPAPTSVPPYQAYVQSQKAYMQDAIREDRAFFQGMYSTVQRTTTLPGHPGFAVTRPHRSARHSAHVPPGTWSGIQKTAGALGVTPFSVLFAAYARLIAGITRGSEVIIAMVTNGRVDQHFQSTIGPFTAPFPVRVATGVDGIDELIAQCHRSIASVTSRSRYPVSDLVTNVPVFKGFPIDTYFTDVGINFTNYRREEDEHEPRTRVIEVLGPVVEPEFMAANTEELQRIPGLHLVLDVIDGDIRAHFWYHTARFSEALLQAWGRQYVDILCSAISEGADTPLSISQTARSEA
ncbi:MAG: SDR family NAD(P)-dependent oxidoreductase [Aquabacterium sp.]